MELEGVGDTLATGAVWLLRHAGKIIPEEAAKDLLVCGTFAPSSVRQKIDGEFLIKPTIVLVGEIIGVVFSANIQPSQPEAIH